jgi:hypothetical protein
MDGTRRNIIRRTINVFLSRVVMSSHEQTTIDEKVLSLRGGGRSSGNDAAPERMQSTGNFQIANWKKTA